MSMLEYLKIQDIILSLFLHKNWTGLILLAPTVHIYIYIKICDNVTVGDKFKSNAEGRSFFINHRFDCVLQYVGSTIRPFAVTRQRSLSLSMSWN